MKKLLLCLLVMSFFFLPVSAEDFTDSIFSDLELNRAKESIPDSVKHGEIEFSPQKTPAENGLTVDSVFKSILFFILDSLKSEIPFVAASVSLLVVISLINSLVDPSKKTLSVSVRFATSAVFATLVVGHLSGALERALRFTEEISAFMTALLPFFASLSAAGGEFTTAMVQKGIVSGAITIFQNFIVVAVFPLCKISAALSLVGYLSELAFSKFSSLISSVAIKVITVSGSLMCAILYFQNSVASVTDSLALRSMKLAAGNFIPVVGSFVSEASGTLISGVKLVKTTFGVFAIAVLLYMTLRPLVNFFIIKLSLRFVSAVSSLIGADKESKIAGEISSVYNVFSAAMISSACYFLFFIAVFIKSEVT